MRVSLFIISCCFLVFGCSSIPTPITYEYSEQKKMQAAQHWNTLAEDVANKINNELIRNDFLNAAVYVKETCGNDAEPCDQNETSQFNEGFRDLLVTQLVNFGIPTNTEIDRDIIVVDYKVQIVHHSGGRVPVPATGSITALTAAVVVLRNAPAELMAIVLAGAFDFYNTVSTMHSNYEVIITSSMVSKKKYIFRSSDIYYINDSDFWHYRDYGGKSKEIQLTGTSMAEQPAVHENTRIPDLELTPKQQPPRDI